MEVQEHDAVLFPVDHYIKCETSREMLSAQDFQVRGFVIKSSTAFRIFLTESSFFCSIHHGYMPEWKGHFHFSFLRRSVTFPLGCGGWMEGLGPSPREEHPFGREQGLLRLQQLQAGCTSGSPLPFPGKASALAEAAFQAPRSPAAFFYFSLGSPLAVPNRLLSRKVR